MQKTLGILKFVLQYLFISLFYLFYYIFFGLILDLTDFFFLIWMHFLHPLLKVGSSKIFKTLINK